MSPQLQQLAVQLAGAITGGFAAGIIAGRKVRRAKLVELAKDAATEAVELHESSCRWRPASAAELDEVRAS